MGDVYYVWRLKGGQPNLKEPGSTKKRLPRFKHQTLESAKAEAEWLSDLHPGSRFAVLHRLSTIGPKAEPQPAT